tara:strand:- start:112 stop:510 length:399 start_codon:yes stop_codon:yes gene_type:complete
MATEIIVNDGGAPSRILPFTANETIAAGDYVVQHTNGQIQPVKVSGAKGIGVSLTAATSGNVVNVVTGKGVLLRTFCSGAINPGAEIAVQGAAMYLETATTVVKGQGSVVGIYAETTALTTGDGLSLKKVIL